jgi:hypothetical protein
MFTPRAVGGAVCELGCKGCCDDWIVVAPDSSLFASFQLHLEVNCSGGFRRFFFCRGIYTNFIDRSPSTYCRQ